MFNIVNLLLKKNVSVEKNALECFGCWWVFDGGLGRKSYLGPGEISSVVCTWLNSRMGDAGQFVCIASGKSQSVKGASRQPAFMDSCLTCLFSFYLIDKLIHICSVPLTFSHSRASGGSFDDFQGQNYVALLRGNKMSVGFHYRNWVLGI